MPFTRAEKNGNNRSFVCLFNQLNYQKIHTNIKGKIKTIRNLKKWEFVKTIKQEYFKGTF